jgi:hypothetical protein
VTGPAPGPEPEPDDPHAQARADWIRGIDAALGAAGLAPQLNQTAAGLDVTATIHHPGRKPAEIVVDEDGYLEIRWWSDRSLGPQEVAAAITRALTALAPTAADSSAT